MAFFTEPEPLRGQHQLVTDGIIRLVARNPSKMTYHGTNSYLIQEGDGYTLLDPGPAADEQHIDDIVRVGAGRIHTILISHHHADHCGALSAIRERVQAQVCAFHTPVVEGIDPDRGLGHLDRIGSLTALHTPGHAPDHLCFARDDGVVFTADHVMGWSSSVVSPPNGNMGEYFASLQMLIDRDDPLYLPGHGPALRSPIPYVQELLRRRMEREGEIHRALQQRPATAGELRRALYPKVDPVLQAAAERNVLAHLAKLELEGKVGQEGERWFAKG